MTITSSKPSVAPFSQAAQLCDELDELEKYESGTSTKDGIPLFTHLPGHPCISLHETGPLERFLYNEFYSEDLESLAPHLWVMSTQSSTNVNPLHQQRVRGRDVIVTESPRLHLVWIHNRVFIKPLPRYLLSHAFWGLLADPLRLGDQQKRILMAAKGFLRTYRYLIQHESDFLLAKQDHLRLIPEDITWPALCRFLNEVNQLSDSEVSERYHFGELRLSRLNFYAPLLLRRFNYEQVHGQYADYFARLYGPILFIFAIISTILNSMQVEIAVEGVSAANWVTLWPICRWFGAISLVATAAITLVVIMLWLWMIGSEWVYAIKCRWQKMQASHVSSTC